MTAALRMASSTNALPYTQQLAAFLKNKPKCVFSNLQVTHHTFAASLDRRVKGPWQINQASTYLCGPNAFFFCLASKSPDLFTKYVLDLWTYGEAKLGDVLVKPSRSCLDTRIKVYIQPTQSVYGIDPVDWVALASLRDSANGFFNYDSLLDGTAGITLPQDMRQWFNSTTFSSASGSTNLVATSDIDNLLRAQRAFSAGKYVCLFISSKVDTFTRSLKSIPNHWAVMTGDILIGGRPLKSYPPVQLQQMLDSPLNVTVATWGKGQGKHSLGMPAGLPTLGQFLNHYFGFVEAK